ADDAAQALDRGGACPLSLGECIDTAAARLADEMLAAKFVQGLPVVGIAGGLQNVPVYRRVTSYAARAYEKRALLRRG
ncbi:MAG: EcsC family protein, partial [Agathobaculum sp.]